MDDTYIDTVSSRVELRFVLLSPLFSPVLQPTEHTLFLWICITTPLFGEIKARIGVISIGLLKNWGGTLLYLHMLT